MRELVLLIISLCILATYAYMGYVLVIGGTDIQNSMLVYGSVSALAGAVVQYWFGSSKGSADKDKAISNLAKGEQNEK